MKIYLVSSRGQEKSDLQNKTEPLEKAEQFDKVKPANTDLTIESRIFPCLHIGRFVPPHMGATSAGGQSVNGGRLMRGT